MLGKSSPCYEFGNVRYFPGARVLASSDGKRECKLSGKLLDFLESLLARKGKIVTYAEIWAEVWPEDSRSLDRKDDSEAVRHHINVYRGRLVKQLQQVGGAAELIENLPGKGYRLTVRVRLTQPAAPPRQARPRRKTEPEEKEHSALLVALSRDEGAGRYVWTVSGWYAALFVVALFLEIAYAWDSYGAGVLRAAPFAWLWMGGAMAGSLRLAERIPTRKGLLTAVLWLVAAQAALMAAMSYFLPPFAVTQTTRQAQSAFGAYCKNAFVYFLPLAVFLLLIPFHARAVLRRELAAGNREAVERLLAGKANALNNLVYFKPLWITVVLGVMALLSLVFTFDLLNNLRPGTFFNLFTLLVFGRMLAFFSLGVAALLWYENALRKLRAQIAGETPISVTPLRERKWMMVAAAWLLACGWGFVWAVRAAVRGPRVEQLQVLAPPAPGRQFAVRLEGRGFDSQTVRLGVTGPGCAAIDPCIVPNDVLRRFGEVSDRVIENAPLTLADGEFQLFLQHGNNIRSNPVSLSVPEAAASLSSNLK